MSDGDYITVTGCRWLLACDGEPAHLVSHAVLGGVVTCARCVARFGLADRVVGDFIEVNEVTK